MTELCVPEEWRRWDEERGKWAMREDDESEEDEESDDDGDGDQS